MKPKVTSASIKWNRGPNVKLPIKNSAPGFLRKCYELRCIIKLSTLITFSIWQVRVSCETRLVVIHFLWMVCWDPHFYYKWTNDQLIRRTCTDGLIGDLHSSTIAWGGSVLDGCHTFTTNWDLHREAKFEGKSYYLLFLHSFIITIRPGLLGGLDLINCHSNVRLYNDGFNLMCPRCALHHDIRQNLGNDSLN